MVLTKEQNEALKLFKKWFKSKDKYNKPFILAGLAGTGKSSVLPFLIESIGLDYSQCAFVAFTGKASRVMQQKGLPATTIHRLIYEPRVDSKGKVFFVRRYELDVSVKLIVCDEASTVGKRLQEDLEHFNIPILYVGDHGQLDPVGDDVTNLMLEPSYRLETIHRQALDSPIIRIAHLARQGRYIEFGSYGGLVKKIKYDKLSMNSMIAADQILCGMNKTRKVINNNVREALGHTDPLPVKGDKLICLKNNYNNGLVNGMIGTCEYYDNKKHILDFTSDDFEIQNIHIDKSIFHSIKAPEYDKNREQFDFGYSCTVHKYQGSQANNIIVIEEYFGRDYDLHNKWLYTAITRAINKLIIVSH